MIVDVQKEKLENFKEEFKFIKECLWPVWVWNKTWGVEKRATLWGIF